MRFTSYKDKGEQTPIGKMESNTADGLRTCYQRTEEFAKQQLEDVPSNTRSNPADRIKSFRENISWGNFEEKKIQVLKSSSYKKSAILFINCVLAATYGEDIQLISHTFGDLISEQNYPGRKFFISELLKAIYGDENIINFESIIFIYNNSNLIGLLSSAGPIPAVETDFNYKSLKVDGTSGTKSLIDALTDQDKQLLKFWLDSNSRLVENCDLYNEILSHLADIEVDASITRAIKIDALDSVTKHFPALTDYNGKILTDTITLIPVEDQNSTFGYDMPALKVQLRQLWYTFIPPLSDLALSWTHDENFQIKSIKIEHPTFEGVLDSVKVICEIVANNLTVTATKSYKKEQIRYVKKFPAISVYGPSPQFGWIALRKLEPENPRHSPLPEGSTAMIDGLTDIELVNADNGRETVLNFDDVEENFYVYCGNIPKWLGIKGNGNWLGGIPMRIIAENMQGNWKEAPAYVHDKNPQSNEKLKVAVDIGSSRTVVLFWPDLANRASIDDALIKKDQKLAVILTQPLDSAAEVEANFENISFQSEKSERDVRGKTPFGVFPTTRMKDDNVLLYKSGKVVLLDPKTVSDAANKKGKAIISDIKTKLEERNNEMRVLVQGILTMIVDRATHMGYSNIDIRASYLTEQYTRMQRIWSEARENIEALIPNDSNIEIEVNLCLPESLAIANTMSHENRFQSGSGAVFIDIGDLSTDIALFRNKTSGNISGTSDVELVANCSYRFAGNKILLTAIWDYLLFSNMSADRLFQVANDENAKKIVAKLEEQRKSQVSVEQVRNNLLCLMSLFPTKNLPSELQNLFDIGYLAEVLILKHLLEEQSVKEGDGTFNIHLFGGGSTYFNSENEGFNWSAVLGRQCKTYDESDKGNTLATGLLFGRETELHENIRAAAKKEEQTGESYEVDLGRKPMPKEPSVMELRTSYLSFAKSAENLKALWRFQDKYGNNHNTLRVLNVISDDSDDYKLLDESVWTTNYDNALTFARSCYPNDQEIFKILFDYKMAYLAIISFYKGERGENV